MTESIPGDGPPAIRLRQTFGFCPRCGQPLPSPGSHPARCTHCQFVHYFSPIAAVGAVLSRADGHVLLLVRGKQPRAGSWCLPGGFVDVGESLEEAARREVLEETGWQPQRLSYLCSAPNEYDYAGIRVDVMDAFFYGKIPSEAALIPEAGEVAELVWADPTDRATRQRLAFDSHRTALAQWMKLFDES